MDSLLEIVINEPFQAELIKHLYSDKKDLQLAFPKAKYPFCSNQWQDVVTSDPENTSLIFKINNRIVGHSSLISNGENLYLCFLVIDRELRGQNLAKQMISQSEEFCRLNYQHHDLWLNVSKTNSSAFGLYNKLGYSVVSESGDKITMKKKLKK